MKKLINLLSVFILAASLFSCTEGDNTVDFVLQNTKYGGGSLRNVAVTSPNITLGDPAAKFSVQLEVQDIENGKGTSSIEIYVSFKDNSTKNGNNPKSEVLLRTVSSTDFVAGARELLNANIVVTITELKTKLALTNAQFTGGDQFTIRLVQVLKDGRRFTNTNASANITGGAYFSSPFLYNANVVCIINAAIPGVYSVRSTGASTDSGPTPDENPISNYPYTVTITATGGGNYRMSDGYGGLYLLWYDIYGINREYPGVFTDICGDLSGTYVEPFDTNVIITGKVNDNGTLSIRWENGYGDFGSGIYTKQN